MPKKIFVLLGHPDSDTLNGALFDAYIKGAKKGKHSVRSARIGDLKFDPMLHKGYKEIQKLEPDLLRVQRDIQWADHVVCIFPTWWTTVPALLKGLVDRIFLPGFGFKFHKNGMGWDKLLTGRSGRIITTMMAPYAVHRLMYGSPGIRTMKDGTFGFCGIKPTRVTVVDRVSDKKSEAFYKKWLDKIESLGMKGQ